MNNKTIDGINAEIFKVKKLKKSYKNIKKQVKLI